MKSVVTIHEPEGKMMVLAMVKVVEVVPHTS
jgi:hypothetical protein